MPQVLRKIRRILRNAGPLVAVGLVLLIGGISFWQAWKTATHLRGEARKTSRIYGEVVAALSDTTARSTTGVLLQLVSEITGTGIPLIVTDSAGRATAWQNIPFDGSPDDPRLSEIIDELDRYANPISLPGMGQIHFGPVPSTRRLSWVPIFQALLLALAVLVTIWAYRNSVGRSRDKLWVAVARESAHQMGTPLMSAKAWIERLADGDSSNEKIAAHLAADVERLERVAQRFERIGRPARQDQVALGALAERVSAYFNARLPRLANRVTIDVIAPNAGPVVSGDNVLLEWALESLVRNSVDALSGRGGKITLEVFESGDCATISVRDDGPGVALSIRSGIFEPGVSTKSGGWGIGLPLAKRIVEDVHGGSLKLVDSNEGTVFLVEIPSANT